ncbi:MAG: fibronectin type III domain-containing protein, partial [Bacteroidales bacterium]|nr:fibronectin type III domain-containing protein [Bacteroidales bacterium]
MKHWNVFLLCLMFLSVLLRGQISINTTGANPDNSSMLDIQATDKGLLIPRLTTAQRNAISNPANSLLIFNTTTRCFEWYDAQTSQWIQMSCGCVNPSIPTANSASNIQQTSFTANWTASSGATGYYLDVATDNSFTTFVSGYNNLNVGNVTSYAVTGLTCNTTYYYRVRAYNSCGTSGNSNTRTVTTSSCIPTAPACGSQVFMLANMDVGVMVNDPAEQNNDSQVEKYCYNNVASNCVTYGG